MATLRPVLMSLPLYTFEKAPLASFPGYLVPLIAYLILYTYSPSFLSISYLSKPTYMGSCAFRCFSCSISRCALSAVFIRSCSSSDTAGFFLREDMGCRLLV